MAFAMKQILKSAEVIREAETLIITAGAGMGVDSGLPDFRGPEGFWKAYPPFKKLGLHLQDTSNPKWFEDDPHFAWGFFGHRYNLYSKTAPHNGFQILKKWAEKMSKGYFVFTSNVDGHFQRSGFSEDKIVECHGSINFMQCTDSSISDKIWPVPEDFKLNVDPETFKCIGELPMGPPEDPTNLARPNILMFGDWGWIGERTEEQEARYRKFKQDLFKYASTKFVVIELGAGLAVPTVRYESEGLVGHGIRGTLIRINPREPDIPYGSDHISIPKGALETLEKIDEIMEQKA